MTGDNTRKWACLLAAAMVGPSTAAQLAQRAACRPDTTFRWLHVMYDLGLVYKHKRRGKLVWWALQPSPFHHPDCQ